MKGRKPNLTVIHGGGKAKGKCPLAPSWLSKQAKAEWKRVAPELHRRSLLNAEGMATLESYCVSVGTVRECEEIMAAEGRVIRQDGQPVAHPAFRIQQGAMREARLLASELALTPHRQALRGGKDEGDDRRDPWAGLVDG